LDTQQVLAQVEAAFSRGEYGRVVYSSDQYLKNHAFEPVWPQLLLWKGIALQRVNPAWQGQAISCFREGIALAGKDRPTKARLMVALAKIHAELGDCTSCEKLMKEFKRVARDRDQGVMRWAAHMWYNYGCTLDNAFRYTEAAPAFSAAVETAREFGVERMLGSALHNLGGVYLNLGRLTEAKATMQQAEVHAPGDFAAKLLSRRAEYSLAAGDLAGAQHWVTEALLHPLVDDMTRADVYFTWAQVLHRLNLTQQAYDKALQALDFAVRDMHLAGIHKLNGFLQLLGPRT